MLTAPRLLALPLTLLTMLLVHGCGGSEETGKACAESDFVAQCPAGTNVVLDAQAASFCSGSVDASSGVVDVNGTAVGQCMDSGGCQVYCQFQTPCPCGVARLSRDEVVCAECQAQSCGDGRCDGTERADCASADGPCFTCPEDCSGATCGDGDCTADESPTSCPQDCANACTPNEVVCAGSRLRICAADGSGFTETDCALAGLVCASGQCVPANVCGNGVCESGESPQGCPSDCSTACEPGARRCDGDVLVTCAANGQDDSRTNCAEGGRICASWGECVDANICTNGRCEAGETAESCPADCQVVCGNERCENGESVTCPTDCVVCGNDRCEAGEQTTCPQDCGVCVPNSRACVGTILSVCAANGQSSRDFDCAAAEQVCARGECVAADVCGNGACEAGERESCPADCAEVCGNGLCGPGETFASCANDCEPICGDGACDAPVERAQLCPVDCLATCGNGTCDATESRERCAADCGFCGDGVCQDGYESPSDRPIGDLEPCRADCVVLGCQQDSDCNDRLACTFNACVDGACIYTASDTLCGQGERCLPRAGCCADADGDSFTALSCGGSDCDDDDFDRRPGALEVCGGGDLNCNGIHRPAVSRSVVNVTRSLYGKTQLGVGTNGARFLVVWRGQPEGAPLLEYALLRPDGTMDGPVRTLANAELLPENHEPGYQPGVVFSQASARFIVTWWDNEYGDPKMWIHTLTPQGTLEPLTPITARMPYPTYSLVASSPVRTAWFGDRLLIHNRFGCYCGYRNGWYEGNVFQLLSEAGGVTTFNGTFSDTQIPYAFDTYRTLQGADRLLVSNGETLLLHEFSGDALPARTLTPTAPLNLTTQSAVDVAEEATTLITITGLGVEGVVFDRYVLGGERLAHTVVSDLNLTPLDSFWDEAARQMALVLTDGTNLYFGIVAHDGTRALDIGLVAAGDQLQNVSLVRDAEGYAIFWTALSGGLRQVFMTRVSCE